MLKGNQVLGSTIGFQPEPKVTDFVNKALG